MTLISPHRGLWAGAIALALALTSVPAGAQHPGATRGIPAQMPSPPPAASPAAKAVPAGEAGLRQRVEQLEEQLVDMQVVIGTLESLARGASPPPAAVGAGRQPGAAAAYGAAEAGRLDSIETQIRALGAQMEQLQEQVRELAARPGALPAQESLAAAEPASPAAPQLRPQLDLPDTGRTAGFGSVTVSPDRGQDDQIGRVLSAPPPPLAAAPLPPAAAPPPAPQTASAPPPDTGLSAKQLYEQAYGYLLQRDYGAAEQAFETFLSRHAKDPLAGNAQYWLGESLYVRGQYRAAAGAFLKGYQNYARSPKAPESLLKLAMSLQRLGQKDAACSSYSELTSKFPTLPSHVKSTAQSEQRKAGC
jgi:tol-pal system protein YbgF